MRIIADVGTYASLGLSLLLAAPVHAATDVPAGSSGDDAIYVGITTRQGGVCFDYAGGGCPGSGVHNYACRNNRSDGTDTAIWFYLGNGLSGLADDFNIQGGNGNDIMRVYRGVGNPPSGNTCRGATSWNSPTYNSKFVDLHGQGHDDSLDGGDVNTWLWGGTGGDLLVNYTASSQIDGGGGNDIFIGVGDGISYQGGAGNDCVHNFGASATYSMGAGTDTWAGSWPCPSGGFSRYISAGGVWCGDFDPMTDVTGC